MTPSAMEEEATTSETCKKVFNSHKPIKESKKSKENMIHPIEDKESHNSVSKKVTSPTRKMITTALLTLKPKFLTNTLKMKEAKVA